MAVKQQMRRSRRSGGLHEPFIGHEILKENDTRATFQYHCEITSRNELPPPFIIDAPHFEDRLDDRRSCFLTARPPQLLFDRLRYSTGIQFHSNQLWLIQGS